MDVQLRVLSSLDSALDLAEGLDAYAADATADFRDHAPPAGTGLGLLKRVFEAPEGLVLVAEREAARIGYLVTGPLIDPLVGDRLPMVLALYVDQSYRHRGLARALVDRAVAELEGRGMHFLAARAGHNDDALISMGERWGFVRHWELMVRE